MGVRLVLLVSGRAPAARGAKIVPSASAGASRTRSVRGLVHRPGPGAGPHHRRDARRVRRAAGGARRRPPSWPSGSALDPLGAEMLASTLVALGYLERDGERLRNAPVSERLLVRSSPESIATFVGAQARPALAGARACCPRRCATARRTRCTRSAGTTPTAGRPTSAGCSRSRGPSTTPTPRSCRSRTPRRMVDVAGGHGGFAMAMCRRHPGLEATVLDLPPSAAVGRAIVAEQGFADRVALPRGRRLRARPRRGPRRRVGLQPDPPPARGARPRAVPDGARGAAARRLPRDRRLGAARAGRAGVRARRDLEPALLRVEPPPQLHAAPRSAAWLEEAGFGEVEVHRNERSPWRIVVATRLAG